jgi:hypothetical protein
MGLLLCLLDGWEKKATHASASGEKRASSSRCDSCSGGSSANFIVHLISPCAHFQSTTALCFGGYTLNRPALGLERASAVAGLCYPFWLEEVMGLVGDIFPSILISSNRPIGDADWLYNFVSWDIYWHVAQRLESWQVLDRRGWSPKRQMKLVAKKAHRPCQQLACIMTSYSFLIYWL